MAKASNDFTDVLVKRKILSADQVEEARNVASSTGVKLQEALIKMNYATAQECMECMAEFHGMEFIDLTDKEIPKSVIELVPESVARENLILPISLDGMILKIATADPSNYDTIQKLQFILNKDIQPVLADNEQITDSI